MDRKTISDQPKLLVTINTAELGEIVEAAVQRALSKKPPEKDVVHTPGGSSQIELQSLLASCQG